MTKTTKRPVASRQGEVLKISRETVTFGRNVLSADVSRTALQPRLFVNDPWELIAEAIARAVPQGRNRDIAQSFRRQAQDYFRAATVGSEIAVRPVLLYYAFLNLSKAYLISRGSAAFATSAHHGISFPRPKPRAIPGALVRFEANRSSVFNELLSLLGGHLTFLKSTLKLGHLMPQILPGHRLWCYATNQGERFLTVERFDIRHSAATNQVWLGFHLNLDDLLRLGLNATSVLSAANLNGFEHVEDLISPLDEKGWVYYQQQRPVTYANEPREALFKITQQFNNSIWETVRLTSPYRKQYLYCCPTKEQRFRLPEMLSIYLLMFVLGSITRYIPGYFDELFESKYGPFFGTFISESPMQFLYLMASDIVGREVSKPAII
jgi:hypothetical protein